MNKSPKYSPEVRERAVRMVQEHRGEYQSLWAAVESIAPKIGCSASTLLDWVKRTGGRLRIRKIKHGKQSWYALHCSHNATTMEAQKPIQGKPP
jgi:transposase-like protein